MKRYQQILDIIEKLEKEDARLEAPIEDAYNDMMKNWDIMSNKNRCKAYWEKLMEQSKEINIRVKVHQKSLDFIDSDNDRLAWINEDGELVLVYRVIDGKELPRFTLWLMMLNEELGEE